MATTKNNSTDHSTGLSSSLVNVDAERDKNLFNGIHLLSIANAITNLIGCRTHDWGVMRISCMVVIMLALGVQPNIGYGKAAGQGSPMLLSCELGTSNFCWIKSTNGFPFLDYPAMSSAHSVTLPAGLSLLTNAGDVFIRHLENRVPDGAFGRIYEQHQMVSHFGSPPVSRNFKSHTEVSQDILSRGHLATDPVRGEVIGVESTGRLYKLDPATDATETIIDLNLAPFILAADAVYDISTSQVKDFSGQILPGKYILGDLSVASGAVTENQTIFFTGVSVNTAFLAKIVRTRTNSILDARVLIASSQTTSGNVNFPRGVAVNSIGWGLTTLPTVLNSGKCGGSSGIPCVSSDVAISFMGDFDPNQFKDQQSIVAAAESCNKNSMAICSVPLILFRNPDGSYLDFSSIGGGITSDSDGDFYVAPGAIGTSSCLDAAMSSIMIVRYNFTNSTCSYLKDPVGNEIISVNPLDYLTDIAVSTFDGENLIYVTTSGNQLLDIHAAYTGAGLWRFPLLGPNLDLSITAPPTTIVGADVKIDVIVNNSGTETATNLEMNVLLPSDVSNVRCKDCQKCSLSKTNFLACSKLTNILANGTYSWDVIFTSTAPGNLTGDVLVRTDIAEFDRNNNYKTFAISASAPVTQTLSVTLIGPGSGSVSSLPAGIDCGATCAFGFNAGTVVALTATPATGSTFAGWSGACTGTGGCSVTLDQAKSVTTTFDQAAARTFNLTVGKAGSGSGSITSDVGGIDCGTNCSANITSGTQVTLTATPNTGSEFVGWSGACSGTAACVLSISETKNATATFNTVAQPPAGKVQLTVTSTSDNEGGTGRVVSKPGGVSCAAGGSKCSKLYSIGRTVKLIAKPAANSDFAGWGGACSGTDRICVLTLAQSQSVFASFSIKKLGLSVQIIGNGLVQGATEPAIDCGAECEQVYPYGSKITLTATPEIGATFKRWSGACARSKRKASCTVTMKKDRAAIALFQ